MTARTHDSLVARLTAALLLAVFCCNPLFSQETGNAEAKPAATDGTAADSSDAAASDQASEAKGNGKDKADTGQNDLDEAIIKRIDAETENQLEAVAVLLESALQKGLDEENQSFAKKMLGSVLLQRSQRYAAGMMRAGGRRQLQLRDDALAALDEAIDNDPTLVEAYMLMAQLNLLPGGDKDAVAFATSKAIELLKDDPVELSSALVLRALTQTDNDKKLTDLDAAAKADPNNMEAYQARAALRLQTNDVEGAVADLEIVLLKDPTNQAVAGVAVQKLVDLDRVDDALELITKMLAAKPSEGMYRMRAILYRSEEKLDDAMSDLNKAISMQPKDPMTLLQRAELALDRDDVKSAKADLASAEATAPQIRNAEPVIRLRSRIALQENRLADAINDAKLLLDMKPDDVFRRLRLASLYSLDQRKRKAIDMFTSILASDPENVAALRSRGDALLSVGDHTSAIEDYESAIKAIGEIDADSKRKPEAAGIYNNLAWVLSTSPNSSVRDGERAIKYAERAAELSDYKAAHILSTLGAAYAENGDFENAIKWSSKAVELGTEEKNEQIDQLKLELESYRENKPWREKQETEENAVPLLSAEDLIDT